MNKKLLIKKIKEFIPVKENDIEECDVEIKEMAFADLRDSLIGLGTILDEDFEINTYVISVPAGLLNMNSAVVALQLDGNDLCMLGYAKEGIIKQHTVKKAIDKVVNKLSKYIVD
jgi:hypothetical protein